MSESEEKYEMEVYRGPSDLDQVPSHHGSLDHLRYSLGLFAQIEYRRLAKALRAVEQAVAAANDVRYEMVRGERLKDQLLDLPAILLKDRINRQAEIDDAMTRRSDALDRKETLALRREKERIELRNEIVRLEQEYARMTGTKSEKPRPRKKSGAERIKEYKEDFDLQVELLRTLELDEDSNEYDILKSEYENKIMRLKD